MVFYMLFNVDKSKDKKNPGNQKDDSQLEDRESGVCKSGNESEIQDQRSIGNIGLGSEEGTATGVGDTTNASRRNKDSTLM